MSGTVTQPWSRRSLVSPPPSRCEPCVSPLAFCGADGLTGTAAGATRSGDASDLTHPEVREQNVSTTFQRLSSASVYDSSSPTRNRAARALTLPSLPSFQQLGLAGHGFIQEPDVLSNIRLGWGQRITGHTGQPPRIRQARVRAGLALAQCLRESICQCHYRFQKGWALKNPPVRVAGRQGMWVAARMWWLGYAEQRVGLWAGL